MKKFLLAVIAAAALAAPVNADEVLVGTIKVQGNQKWWNAKTDLNPLRLAPPQSGAEIKYYDINGDGKPELLRTVTADGTPVQWVDDDHNMKVGDVAGDLVNDCLMIDRNRDGKYGSYDDLMIDWSDTDGDGKADIQVIVENVPEGGNPGAGHYMIVLDDDRDGVFNYVDWNSFKLRCWLHNGLADFYTDYNGNSTFLKNHGLPERQRDVRLNWENPFVFIDLDNDGLTEKTVRLCDEGRGKAQWRDPDGNMHQAYLCWDLDNDNNPENPLDLDMTIRFESKKGNLYATPKYTHVYSNLRGLPEADKYFLYPCWRQNNTLIFPDRNQCESFVLNEAKWDWTWFCFDEDGDCKRWERVELYQPKDIWKIGSSNGGVDNNPQADVIGDRGEWDEDNSGNGNLYVSPIDGKIHLYGAEWGVWRIDQRAQYYQMMGGLYDVYGPGRVRQQTSTDKFPTIKYEDVDANGFFDRMLCDWDGDHEFEEIVDLRELGVKDDAKVLEIRKMDYKDYQSLYESVALESWSQAVAALKQAAALGLDTSWYALYKTPKSLRQKYEYGYWLRLYIYHDIVDLARRTGNKPLEVSAAKAFFGQGWKSSDNDSLKYVDAATLPVYGKIVANTFEPFSRLPESMKSTARGAIWDLGRHSAGVYLRFVSDAPSFNFKWTSGNRNCGDNMSAISKHGLALYVLDNGVWTYAGTARPRKQDDAGRYEHSLNLSKLGGKDHEYMLYLGLYDGIKNLSIGVPEGSKLTGSSLNSPRKEKAVIMYGTSILQGASASHPGLCSTALLGRKLNRQVINLGFSGNALLDSDVAQLIASYQDPGAIVLDFAPNGGAKLTREKGEKFFRVIRDAHPDVPVVFVECSYYPDVKYDNKREKTVVSRNEAVKELYAKLKASGEKKLYYVKGEKLLRGDNVGTIEGTHFTDIGFETYCDQLYPVLKKAYGK